MKDGENMEKRKIMCNKCGKELMMKNGILHEDGKKSGDGLIHIHTVQHTIDHEGGLAVLPVEKKKEERMKCRHTLCLCPG